MKKTMSRRRTLKDIDHYPTPAEIYNIIVSSRGWPYKAKGKKREFYLKRDRALVAIIYLLALRISEALRLRKNQFLFPEETGYDDRIVVRGIKLSKSRVKGRPRREQYRQENWLPLSGPRARLTRLVIEYLKELEGDQRLFPFGRVRAWQIIREMTGATCHWFRAFGEDFLYGQWDKDLLAVSDYIKVDPRTLSQYIRRRYEKYRAV